MTSRITLNLTPRAERALVAACAETGENKTDAICRALTLYAVIVEADAAGHMIYLERGGLRERLRLL